MLVVNQRHDIMQVMRLLSDHQAGARKSAVDIPGFSALCA